MTFDAIAAGLAVFVDANALLHYFTAHPRYGRACQKLLDRIENKEITGFTSAHVLTEVVHRLMTIEACQRFDWPAKGIAQRLRKHPAEVQHADHVSCPTVILHDIVAPVSGHIQMTVRTKG